MNSNTLKLSLWWLLKAAVLVSLSFLAIFLSSPKAEAATTLSGQIITQYGSPVIKLDDAVLVRVESLEASGPMQSRVGYLVKFTCASISNGVVLGLNSLVSAEGDSEVIWQAEAGADQDSGGVGGDIDALPELDKLEGRLVVRHGQPVLDISTPDLWGMYSQIRLLGLSRGLTDRLLDMKGYNTINLTVEGKFDVLTVEVTNLWADNILLMRDGHDN